MECDPISGRIFRDNQYSQFPHLLRQLESKRPFDKIEGSGNDVEDDGERKKDECQVWRDEGADNTQDRKNDWQEEADGRLCECAAIEFRFVDLYFFRFDCIEELRDEDGADDEHVDAVQDQSKLRLEMRRNHMRHKRDECDKGKEEKIELYQYPIDFFDEKVIHGLVRSPVHSEYGERREVAHKVGKKSYEIVPEHAVGQDAACFRQADLKDQ